MFSCISVQSSAVQWGGWWWWWGGSPSSIYGIIPSSTQLFNYAIVHSEQIQKAFQEKNQIWRKIPEHGNDVNVVQAISDKKNVGCGCWFWYLEISTLMLARLSMLKCGAVSSGSTFHVSRESCGGRRRFIGCDCRDHRGNGSNIRHHLPNCFHCLRASSSSETGGRLRKTGGGNRTRKQELDVLSVIQGLIRMWSRDG